MTDWKAETDSYRKAQWYLVFVAMGVYLAFLIQVHLFPDPRAASQLSKQYHQSERMAMDRGSIYDSNGEPLFENQCEFPPSMSDVVKYQLDVAYHARPTVDPKLQALGRAAAKGFGLTSRFVHMEFFRLTEEKPGLGGVGDYVGLEVNVRPPGGYTPDMLNFAHSVSTYQIWADMVCFDERRVPESDDTYFACYVGRRDCHEYVHSEAEIIERYGDALAMCGRIPDALSDDLCNQMYVARLKSEEERLAFEQFVMEQREA